MFQNFQPLCQNVRRRIELRSEKYEYYPSHYVETVCRKFTSSGVGKLSRNTQNQVSLNDRILVVNKPAYKYQRALPPRYMSTLKMKCDVYFLKMISHD